MSLGGLLQFVHVQGLAKNIFVGKKSRFVNLRHHPLLISIGTCGESNDATDVTRFILMNTVGVANPDLAEKRTWYERALLGLLRHTIPPHRDNETAVEYLYRVVGKENRHIEWCSVRPDSLINAEVSAYDIEASPVTGIFTGRPTTRSNVAHFMCELVGDETLWGKWKFRMPVIMNSSEGIQ